MLKRLLVFITSIALFTSSAFAQFNYNGYTGPIILTQSGVAASITGTLSETEITSCTVPANSMGANGKLYVQFLIKWPNNSNNKVFRVRFGGMSGDIMFVLTATTTGMLNYNLLIQNTNSTSAQVGVNSALAANYGTSTSQPTTGAQDTTAAVRVSVTGAPAGSGDTMTVVSFSCTLYPAR